MPGIPRASWDYSWGRRAGRDERDERDVLVEHDYQRDYCFVCDKKAVIFQGQCMNCSQLDEKKSNR